MKTAEEILAPYIETPFRHTKVVEKDNALLAMKQFADQFRLSNEWISVKDKKPEDYKTVLFFDSRDRSIGIGYFVWSQTTVYYVTHWMDVPSQPI